MQETRSWRKRRVRPARQRDAACAARLPSRSIRPRDGPGHDLADWPRRRTARAAVRHRDPRPCHRNLPRSGISPVHLSLLVADARRRVFRGLIATTIEGFLMPWKTASPCPRPRPLVRESGGWTHDGGKKKTRVPSVKVRSIRSAMGWPLCPAARQRTNPTLHRRQRWEP